MSTQQPIIEEGRTVEEAIEKALSRLGINREEAKIEVIEKESKGLFGLGSKPAKVKVSPKNTLSIEAANILGKILELMAIPATAEAYEEDGRIHLEIKGASVGLLIGKRGVTLDALQHLVGLILSKKMGRRSRIVVDAEGYRGRRRQTLINLAQRMANRVRLAGKKVALGPMNPYERHIIHSALQDNREVRTISDGEGSRRQVVILPRMREDSGA